MRAVLLRRTRRSHRCIMRFSLKSVSIISITVGVSASMATRLNIISEVADNDYKTFTREKDLVINIAVGGNPTRIDAIFVKGQDIERHSAAPTGGSGSGYRNRRMPLVVKNWEGTEVSTVVAGFQHDLYLLDQHFTATSVRLTFTGTDAKITEIMLVGVRLGD